MADNEKVKDYIESLSNENTTASNSKLTVYEREFYLNYNEFEKCWYAESSIPKFWRRLEKKNWECTDIRYYPDGTVCSKAFKSNSSKGISITDPTVVRTKVYTEEEKEVMRERMQKMHELRKLSKTDNQEENK